MSDFTTIYNGFLTDSYITGSITDDSSIRGLSVSDVWKYRHIDRTAFAARGALIYGESRDYRNEDNSAHPGRSWKNDSYALTLARDGIAKEYVSVRVHGLCYKPTQRCYGTLPFPGSAMYQGVHDGTDKTKGFLYFQTLAKNAIVAAKIRTIDITDRGNATVGAWSSVYNTHDYSSGGNNYYTWQASQLLFPSGSQPDNMFEVQISWKQEDGSTGPAYLGGIMLYEPKLSSVA